MDYDAIYNDVVGMQDSEPESKPTMTTDYDSIYKSVTLDQPKSADYDSIYASVTGELSEPADGLPSARDESRGFWNNFWGTGEKSELKRYMEEDSAVAGIARFISGSTLAKQEEQKKTAGMDIDPEYTWLEQKAEDAYQAAGGDFNNPEYQKAQAELMAYKNKDETMANMPMSDTFGLMTQAITQDPGAAGAELAKVLLGDPEFLLTPLGWRTAAMRVGGAVAKLGATAEKVGRVAGGVAGTAALGGAIGAADSVSRQLGEGKGVEAHRTLVDAELAAAAGVGLTVMMKGMGKAFGSISRKTGDIEDANKLIEEKAAEQPNAEFDDLVGQVMDDLGADETAKSVAVDEVKIAKTQSDYIIKRAAQEAQDDLRNRPYRETPEATTELQPDPNAPTPPWYPRKPVESIEAQPDMRQSTTYAGGVKPDAGDPKAAKIYKEQIAKKAEEARIAKEKDAAWKEYEDTISERAKRVDHMEEAFTKREAEYNKKIDNELDQMKWQSEAERGEATAMARAFGDAIRSKQSGKIDPKLLAAVTGGAIGGAVMFAQDGDPIDAGIGVAIGLGGVGASVALGKAIGRLARNVKNLSTYQKMTEQVKYDISDELRKFEGTIRAEGARTGYQMKSAIKEMVPDKAEREAMTHFIQGTYEGKVTPEMQRAATKVQDMLEKLGRIAESEGVIESFVENYISQFWKQGLRGRDVLVKKFAGSNGKVNPKTMHAKEKKIPTYQEGLDQDMIPVTLDAAEIVDMYVRNIYKAIASKRLLQNLESMQSSSKRPMIMPSNKAPDYYKFMPHPLMAGKRIHPEIKDALELVMYHDDPNIIARGIDILNVLQKRTLVSASFFHANALIESHMFANGFLGFRAKMKGEKGLPIKFIYTDELINSFFGDVGAKGYKNNHRSYMLEQLRTGKAGDVVDIAMRNGLMIEPPKDVGADVFYDSMSSAIDVLDKHLITKVPAGGIKLFKGMNKVMDRAMWDNGMTSMKLMTFARTFEKEMAKNAKRHAKNPDKYPLESQDAIAQQVAEYVNDAYGGLNWTQLALKSKNKFIRDLNTAMYNKKGTWYGNLGLFAMDWTTANIRIIGKAATENARLVKRLTTGKKLTPDETRMARMHTAYAARAAAFYFFYGSIAQSIINGEPTMVGKQWWEGDAKDPMSIYLEDGRRVVFSKQFAEPAHWVLHPAKTLVNKMGILPKMSAELLGNKQFINLGGYSPPITKEFMTPGEKAVEYGKYGLGKLTPIWGSQLIKQGAGTAALGWLGHPIYGLSEEQKAKMKEQQKEERLRLKQYRRDNR